MKAESRVDCCQVSQGLPATFRQSSDTEKAKAEIAAVPLGTALPTVVATRRRIARPLDSSPPDDVQSLLCTLLI